MKKSISSSFFKSNTNSENIRDLHILFFENLANNPRTFEQNPSITSTESGLNEAYNVFNYMMIEYCRKAYRLILEKNKEKTDFLEHKTPTLATVKNFYLPKTENNRNHAKKIDIEKKESLKSFISSETKKNAITNKSINKQTNPIKPKWQNIFSFREDLAKRTQNLSLKTTKNQKSLPFRKSRSIDTRSK